MSYLLNKVLYKWAWFRRAKYATNTGQVKSQVINIQLSQC